MISLNPLILLMLLLTLIPNIIDTKFFHLGVKRMLDLVFQNNDMAYICFMIITFVYPCVLNHIIIELSPMCHGTNTLLM